MVLLKANLATINKKDGSYNQHFIVLVFVKEAAHENEPRLAVPSCHGDER